MVFVEVFSLLINRHMGKIPTLINTFYVKSYKRGKNVKQRRILGENQKPYDSYIGSLGFLLISHFHVWF
jgi:hypothetical protein